MLLGAAITPAASLAQQVATWQVNAIPEVALGTGTFGPEDQFAGIRAVRRLGDGSIAVLDEFTRSVRVFGPGGAYLRAVGGPGEGPGEFDDPVDFVGVDDSLVVLESNGRLSRFGSDGSFARSERVAFEEACGDRFNGAPAGLLSDGRPVVRCAERMFGVANGEYRQTAGLLIARAGGLDTLGWFPADTGRTDLGEVPIPRPYLPTAELLWASSGEGVIVVPASSSRALSFVPGNQESSGFDTGARGRPTTPTDYAEVMESALRMVSGENDRRVVGEWFSGMPKAAETPPVRELLTGPSGEIWIEAWSPGPDGARWTVFSPAGAPLGRLSVPEGLQLVSVGEGWVLGVWTDELGVEEVRLHGLTRGPGGWWVATASSPLP